MSKTDNLEEILRRIPASQVERIDLIRGGAPGIDMQGKAVIANVIKKPGGGLRGLIAVANNHLYDGRNMHGMRLELSGGQGQRQWEGSARYGYGNDDGGDYGPQVRIGPNGEIQRRSDVRSESDGLQKTLTGAYQQPLFGGVARVNGRMFWDHWKFEEDNRYELPPELGTETTDDTYLRKDTELGGRFNRDFGPRTSLEAIALRQTRDQTIRSDFAAPDFSQGFFLDRESSETIGRAVLKYKWNDRLSFEAGMEGAFNQLDSGTTLSVDGEDVPLPAANVHVEEKRGEAFARGTWRTTDKLTFEGGLRYEASQISSDGDVILEKTLYYAKPRAAVSWNPTTSTQLRASFERVVGQLNFDDFVASANFNTGSGVSAGNPDLAPEQAWVSEASVEQRFWGGGVVVVTVRHSAISDVNDRGPAEAVAPDGTVSYFDQPMNIGDGTKDELIASISFPFDRIGLKGATFRAESTWRRSEVTDPTTGETREISDLRPLEWSANFTHDIPRWRFSYGVDVYSGWRERDYRFDSVNTVKLEDAYIRPFAEWRIQPSLSLRMEAPNLISRGIRITREQYAGPRDTAPLAYTDDRDLTFGQMFYIRVRKTFGS
ncbi:TonB-dependent siderophore receptor [Phenylobacterium sp. J367]|uniref:TonB-dependent receptor plug domain-containing protein n=1 Tax=Phenylobacterium sp. J367 TaxID=2898435 RepID=UPI0021507864|nr:TonB-dependent receptor [Phenylobacterium sp. J367]MCR5877465.1 TonB-dependent receptor [Phenylobacterium sp. J367]